MRNFFNIFVEGEADARFFGQYISHVLGESIPEERLVILNGWNNLKTETYAMRMRSMTANGGINLVVLDADKDIEARRHDIVAWKQSSGVQFNLFLLPNDKDSGALEDMLERIINPINRPILDCWEDYEKELVKLDIPGRTPPPLTTPAKKTKIYGYLEALLGETRSEKQLIKEVNRNYQDKRHWNLDAEYLEPLKSFLCQYI